MYNGMDRIDRRIARDAARAKRQETKHERKEARLHAKAVNAAVHGRMGKAAVLEARAGMQANRAEAARQREQAADAALASRMATRGQQHYNLRSGGPAVVHVVNQPSRVVQVVQPAGYTVTTTSYTSNQPIHYPTGPANQPIHYPTGPTAAPPAYPQPQYPTGTQPAYPEQPPPPYSK